MYMKLAHNVLLVARVGRDQRRLELMSKAIQEGGLEVLGNLFDEGRLVLGEEPQLPLVGARLTVA